MSEPMSAMAVTPTIQGARRVSEFQICRKSISLGAGPYAADGGWDMKP